MTQETIFITLNRELNKINIRSKDFAMRFVDEYGSILYPDITQGKKEKLIYSISTGIRNANNHTRTGIKIKNELLELLNKYQSEYQSSQNTQNALLGLTEVEAKIKNIKNILIKLTSNNT